MPYKMTERLAGEKPVIDKKEYEPDSVKDYRSGSKRIPYTPPTPLERAQRTTGTSSRGNTSTRGN